MSRGGQRWAEVSLLSLLPALLHEDKLGSSYCVIVAPEALRSDAFLCRVLALVSSLTRIELAAKQQPVASVRFESKDLVMDLMTVEAAAMRQSIASKLTADVVRKLIGLSRHAPTDPDAELIAAMRAAGVAGDTEIEPSALWCALLHTAKGDMDRGGGGVESALRVLQNCAIVPVDEVALVEDHQ